MTVTDQNSFAAMLASIRVDGLSKIGAVPEGAGIPHFLGGAVGRPGAWAPGTPGVAGRVTDGTTAADAGCLPCTNAAVGKRRYLAKLAGQGNVDGLLQLIDVLWVNSGLNVLTTTAQAVGSPTLPARDANFATLGAGVEAGILVTTATTNGTAVTNTTLDYTNSQGVTGRTGTIPSGAPGGGFPSTAVAGTLVPFSLAAGDEGVRSIQNVTLGTSYGGGAISLVLFRRIADLPLMANRPGALGPADLNMPRLADGVCLLPLLIPSATTTFSFQGSYGIGEG